MSFGLNKFFIWKASGPVYITAGYIAVWNYCISYHSKGFRSWSCRISVIEMVVFLWFGPWASERSVIRLDWRFFLNKTNKGIQIIRWGCWRFSCGYFVE